MSRRRRSSSTRVVGHAEFKGQHLTVYDNRLIPGIKATVFPHKQSIRGPFGKEFGPLTLHITGQGTKRVRMRKSARRVFGGRTVPVLEADL